VSECDQVKINNLDTCCEQVGRRGKDYEMNEIEILLFSRKKIFAPALNNCSSLASYCADWILKIFEYFRLFVIDIYSYYDYIDGLSFCRVFPSLIQIRFISRLAREFAVL
jgi:hypothetical protein